MVTSTASPAFFFLYTSAHSAYVRALSLNFQVPWQQTGGDAVRGHAAAVPEAGDDAPPRQRRRAGG
jgi:hypothetical protein